ncbi:MAG: UDP-N-acetylmuramoyl-L-alanine--D-glutamate ligase [Patescibacteria group bacterium]|nr:UDP-N-acetylmuramoyl-L-alanine--D-glutamate ligase [Patescibacteria group bacterium]
MFKNKNVLIFGLGKLGGGLSAVEFFIKNKANIRITDLKNRKDLKREIIKINKLKNKYNYSKKIEFILGEHKKEDFNWAEIVMVNPAISYKNKFVIYSQKNKKLVINDCYLFFNLAKGEIIALTGTRGKTTTTYFIYQLFKKFISKLTHIGGNQPDKSLLKILKISSNNFIHILELSSFQLEFYRKNLRSPKIAIITNLYEDHLNRYQTMEEYGKTKAKIFLNQKEDDFLILNYDNKWTKFFLKLKPKSHIFYVSLKKLPLNLNGIYYIKNNIYIRQGKREFSFQLNKELLLLWGRHNIYNLMFALITLFIYSHYQNKKIEWQKVVRFLPNLKFPPFRQQIIYQNEKIKIINDSASTAPQAAIEAIEKFSFIDHQIILIIGGTDKNLNFSNLAKVIKKYIEPKNLIVLEGSASLKIIEELKKIKYNLKEIHQVNNLKECVNLAFQLIKNNKKSIILFSPAAASFEKFKNEFDRGKKFNQLIRYYLKNEKDINRNKTNR